MLRTILCVFVFITLVQCGTGQIIQDGLCNFDTLLHENFDIESFEGQWFEIRRSDERGPDCSSFSFSVDVNSTVVPTRYEAVTANFYEERNGTAHYENGTARFFMSFPPGDPFNFWILRTDYQFHAVAFDCVNISPTQRSVTIWILGRARTLPSQAMNALINTALMNAVGVSINDLRMVDHSDEACFVLPVIEPGDPIVLPGLCDEDIAVVQNFEAGRFLGLWHEIASYESENSQNTCARAEYSLLDDGIRVENSQVINETLFVIDGVARIISNDGSARLSVVLNIGNGEQATRELLILATDYDSYAVSYTCQNLPNDQRQIHSWILGRSRRLSAETQAAVDLVIDREIVLNQQYFRPSDQSDEACFFFPEFVPDTPVIFRGLCETNIPAVANFDPTRYTGIWHDIESYYTSFQTGTCRNANYQLNDGVVDVLNTQVINRTLDTIVGEAVITSNDGSGTLAVTFPVNNSNVTVTTNYYILGTDYTSYSLVYSCTNLDENERQVFAWKLSRSKQLTAQAATNIDNLMSNFPVLDQRYFQAVDQSREGCDYVPEPAPGVPVVFPGLCDPNVQVVQNFNLTMFEGIWHEIEAYPKEQQQGQCINHQYTPGSGDTLNIQSSQVIDQFQGVSNGVLNFTSTNGGAQMNINIVVDGQAISFPFWILATDYTDYALAYSCVQLNDDFRGIYSWKLSRSRQLSATAHTAINNVIAQVPVLGQQFYEPIDQSDEACFFLPELAPGEPVVLVGQCDTSIVGVPNFQANRYLGEWRLIQSYPTEFQEGTCNRAQYSSGPDGSVVVFNTQVINQTLDTIQGSAVLASNDGSAELLVTFPDTPVALRYIVLATDYDSYALVYSCQNINSEQRRVWSWKMSRTNTLTDAATAAINAVVDSINVLNNRYYYTVDNSPQGCFYFPEPAANEPVIFRGNCEQITPVANFNVNAYLGTWHNIELYPSRFQYGTCSNAQYSVGQDGVVVVNSQVVDQALDIITGLAVIASADNSGRLLVTFPVDGTNNTVSLDLYVLATDYLSYSLVYSCENQGEYRQVWSWKLSRSKQLTPASVTAINNAMSNVQVLNNRYFEAVDQSDKGCFYFPEPQPGVPVEFPGSCDVVPVVQNFDLTQFQGVWHEVSTYPSQLDQGDCSSQSYSPGIGNTLDLEYSSVNQLELNVNNGTLAFETNTNDGRLVLTVRISNSDMQIPFQVLAVDYNDYALAYGCVNLPTVTTDVNRRIIYSWKLSRNRQLSANANTAINNAIASVNVLREEYYEDVDQSDDACFFVPEIVPGEVVVFPGQCEHTSVSPVQNFNAAAYLGRWYLIESYPSDFQDGSCNDARYSLGENNTVDVLNTQVIGQTLDTIVGSAVASDDGTGRLYVTFPGAEQPSEYLILATDYTSYALVYSCLNINSDQRAVWSWKLSRTQALTAAANIAINQVVNSVNVLNDRFYEQIDHSPEACFYFPTPDPFTQVRFRGRCDPNINVVQNFNAAAYLGLWHLIESYPSTFQEGTCNNAYYSSGDNVVDVWNTQVINQTLDTTAGVAVVASDDGSAKLMVSFPIGNTNETTTTPYWVIATDYNSYSLVYTCVEDEDEEYVNVWSWKLSRSKQLTQLAVVSINNAMSNIQVLDNRYFVSVDQSDEGCFYYPEPQPGVPVEFPGRCDTIPVVQNFDLSQFQGIWHEVSAYPSGLDLGDCASHTYSLSTGNTLNLEYSSVNQLELNVINGTLAFEANNNDGRLVLSVRLPNSEIQVPFHVLAVDYNDYALAYGCVEVEDSPVDVNRRIIYSWKLSRNRQLSANANTAINSAIASVNVLREEYYEDVDQSDEACFFVPEIVPGEVVVFPGQCEHTSVSPVQNFDAAAYLGRWYLIESYPSDFQDGSCNDARYSLGENNTVDVLNTQVIGQTLDTIVGSAVASADGTGRLYVTFPGAEQPSEYLILATDYTSYALVYSCLNINSDQRAVWSWKLSRTQSLTAAANIAINQVVNSVNVLNDRFYEQIDHSPEGCFYFPAPDPFTQVRFRGRCDSNINVVQNFDVAAYLGLWHLIESYPSTFQEGTCNNAYYSTGGNVVDVWNTQVINQSLDTMAGVAVVASDDGSAKLEVSFPIANTNETISTPYWVLATDYNSYSLVYTCVDDEDGEYKNVWSWKLSRTKQLTTAAATAINAVVNNIQVLDDRYYQQIDQSSDGCFYFPEPEPGRLVVFPGQCENIDVMEPFNPNLFQGVWHEIEVYPNVPNLGRGQCINHDYTSSNNVLQTSHVDDQTLIISNGSLVATDGARMTITVDVDGQALTAPFWIVDTDYNNYALAYSCTNLNADYRSVISWKLSRSRTLSATSQAAISSAMSSIDVIDERYFEPVDQSDPACFHLPDLEPGEPVVFPGQCDTSIPIVENFDFERYLNRWRLIETYASDFYRGTCIEATYSLASDGSVEVFNTQVIDQNLLTITGTAVPASDDGRGILEVTFPGNTSSITYWVLDTDYDSYALVYSCENLNSEQRRVWAWKLSRDRTLSPSALSSIDQVIQRVNVLDSRYFQPVQQSDDACFYYPPPDPSSPVIFRGQCDETIPVVTSFDVERYTGTWYDIESYPQGLQFGTCPTAQYSLGDEGVDVLNTEVRAQELHTITATAVPAFNDGTARLLVTFPVEGTNLTVEVPYWVLATDYDNYALVYSCENINTEYRRVTSWKLSRTQTLSATSSTAINAVLNQVPVLRQPYFISRGHSETDCFFYPDNNGGPVILDGQCELPDQVDVVQNFDASQFSGPWHEAARFPSELQSGECAANQFDYQSGVLQVTATIVDNEELTSFVSTATVANDGRGVFTLNINDTTMNFFVLDVDYDDFALIYACRNVGSNSLQAFSWKLARTREGLSQAAAERIEAIVAREDNLFHRYYEDTAQDNDACFYYPDFGDELPDAITLPGPCNPTIRGMPDFNAGQYVGRWFEIEKYPQPSQGGQCNRALYTPDEDIIDVFNTQVENRTLQTQRGIATLASEEFGELIVTFDVSGVTNVANYYILATDYTNFALVYSCRNLDNGDRQVASWKLSRTPTLTEASNNQIKSVIANTQGLLQDYYTVTDQSPEACFYIPPVDPGQAVHLRGRCDNISGQANFDLESYLGWWHEISSYPTGGAAGDCRSTQYRQSGNQVEFVDTRVTGLTGHVTRGTVVATANGQLTRTWENGETETLWVLATDYTDYALVFSCEEIDDEYVRVWSSKQRKTQVLSPAAEQAISNLVDVEDFLIEDFFLDVSQSDEACFYYPEETGENVVLRGQCDPNIPVQSSFDIVPFTGTWYQIERYPYPEVSSESTCIGTRILYNADEETVSIQNWEIIDDLSTINAVATIPEGSATLRVTITSADNVTRTTDLHILTTDYSSHALAYTCRNINPFERIVVALKLSRTRTLPAPAATAINNYMATRQELHQPFFIPVTHDDDCEDPSSSFLVKSSVILVLLSYLLHMLV